MSKLAQIVGLLACIAVAGYGPCTATAAPPEPPTAAELIEKLSQQEERLEHVTLQGETRSTSRGVGVPGSRSGEQFEVRRDGDLIWEKTRVWGKLGRRHVGKADAGEEFRIYDGEEHLYLVLSPDPRERPTAKIQRDPEKARNRAEGQWLRFGKMITLNPSNGKLTEVLEEAEQLRVRPDGQRVRSFDTVVLEAETDQGDFTLWFSVDHDHALVQVQRVIGEGDMRGGEPAPAGWEEQTRIAALKLRETGDGIWVPVSAIGRATGGGGETSRVRIRTQWRWKLDELAFHPEAGEARDYTFPELPVGTRISYPGDENPNGSIRYYRWDGEKAVPE